MLRGLALGRKESLGGGSVGGLLVAQERAFELEDGGLVVACRRERARVVDVDVGALDVDVDRRLADALRVVPPARCDEGRQQQAVGAAVVLVELAISTRAASASASRFSAEAIS